MGPHRLRRKQDRNRKEETRQKQAEEETRQKQRQKQDRNRNKRDRQQTVGDVGARENRRSSRGPAGLGRTVRKYDGTVCCFERNSVLF
jgi:hypothetical protein